MTTTKPAVSKLASIFVPILVLALLAVPGITQAATCKNEQAREQNNSILLPDCRAYEMVSPLNKNGGDIGGIGEVNTGGVVEANPAGTAITYASLASFATEPEPRHKTQPAGAPAVSQYLATDADNGWSTENISPAISSPNTTNSRGGPYRAFTPMLNEGLLTRNLTPAAFEEGSLGGGPAGYSNYYIHSLTTNNYQALITTPPPGPPSAARPVIEGDAATPDLRHILFTSSAVLTPNATEGRNLYEWNNGKIEAINIPPNPTLPGETITEQPITLGSETVTGERQPGFQSNVMSNDGKRVFWSSGETLYTREGIGTPQAKTVQLDASLGGGGEFLIASSDGSKAFLSTFSNRDLYRYNVENNELSDLIPVAHRGEAGVLGVVGASEDGSYLYFVATRALTPPAAQGQPKPTEGQPNLYLYHEGSGLTYVTTISSGDETQELTPLVAHDWSAEFAHRTTRVSADGRHLVFMSEASLTGYDNTGRNCVPEPSGTLYTAGNCEEVFEYEAGAPSPVCVSCNPSGEPPLGPSSIPGGTDYTLRNAMYQSRALSDEAPTSDGAEDGVRVFFNSNDALSPSDSNEKQDVYEWESQNTGTCVQPAGCIGLISGGTSSESSSFVDASANGDNVFFITRQQLTPGDTDQEVDLYDASVGGGFTTAPALACTGTGCQGLPGTPPVFATPSSITAEGPGNFSPPAAAVSKPAVEPKAKTNAQKLTAALKACGKDRSKAKRVKCQVAAHKRYSSAKRKR